MSARRDRNARRARSVLLWAAGLFALVELSTGLLLDYCWPLLRFPSARTVLRDFAAVGDKPEIVALGSSRFGAGIQAGEMSRLLTKEFQTARPVGVFNASVPAGDAIPAEFLLHRLLDAGARPRLVLLEISPETVNQYNDWLGLHVRRQLRWHDLPSYFVDVCLSSQLVRWAGERLNPIFYHREELWCKAAESLPEFAAQLTAANDVRKPQCRVSPPPESWQDLLRPPEIPLTPEMAATIAAGIGMARNSVRNYRIFGTKVKALERVLLFCQQEGIEVMLIGIPVTKSHRSAYTPDIMTKYRAYLGKVCSQYGCRFFDYRDRVPDNLFKDTHHMIPEGGMYFSRLLTHELLVPYRQGQL